MKCFSHSKGEVRYVPEGFSVSTLVRPPDWSRVTRSLVFVDQRVLWDWLWKEPVWIKFRLHVKNRISVRLALGQT